MITKNRSYPIKAHKLEALLRRLPKNHRKREEIEVELAKILAGYHGEESLDYYISLIDNNSMYILHDLRLPDENGYYFQIDTLILTPSFFLIIESKNLSGELFFDFQHHQLIRKSQEKVDVFNDPIVQTDLQMLQLKKWLVKNKFPTPPIETIVVITHPSALIRTSSTATNSKHNIIRSQYLPIRIEQLKDTFHEISITEKQIQKLTKLFIKNNSPKIHDILQLFNIRIDELLTGVQCSQCDELSMEKEKLFWKCPQCQYVTKDAHIQALIDYFLLVQPTIRNRDLRYYLNINSRFVTNRLIAPLNLPSSGPTKNREYHLYPLYENYH
ncbi:MAG: NERD domain-containing protein [Bacillaceae bacterium]|nr:NERD domain-containing protein [Bacillaceae bacterium]